MTMEWINWEFFSNKYLLNESYEWKKYLEIPVKQLFNEYPTPENWLNTEIDMRLSFKRFAYSEFYYIACWAWEKKLYTNNHFAPSLEEYFLDKRHNSSQVPVRLAKRLHLLNDNEILVIRQHRSILLKSIAIHCLFLSKPLKEFNELDAKHIPEFINNRYNSKALQDIRLKLGYSNVIVGRKGKQSNWDKLIANTYHSSRINEFYNYLLRCDARKKYLTDMGVALNIFIEYLEISKINDCSTFNDKQFALFTEYLLKTRSVSSSLIYISKIKTFFQWGVDSDSFFPKELNFPNEYWSSLRILGKEHRKNSDGWAFSEPDLAQLIFDIIYNFSPLNELDKLCRSFWLIIASCPVRFSYILNIGVENTILPLPNEPDTYGLYSALSDKAGNKYGQFPILDKVGLDVIKNLQLRAKDLNLQPIKNPTNNYTYIHLFQLTESPWILDKNAIRAFFNEKVKPELAIVNKDVSRINASAHGFRHHLLTHVAYITGDISVVQTASGHKNESMTREYLRSKISRDALLFRVIHKYETKEITGKFYLRLIELLGNEYTPLDEMLHALTTEMKMDEFINRYGKRLEMGYCFNNKDCSNWMKCWSCINFLMTRSEITSAVKTLSHQLLSLRDIQRNCYDFSFSHPLVSKQLKTISLIVKRLTELDLTQDNILKMVDDYIHKKTNEKGINL